MKIFVYRFTGISPLLMSVSVRTWARWEVSERVPDGAVKLFEIENGLRKPGK